MNDTITSVVEGLLKGILAPLYSIFDDLHLSAEEEAEIKLKLKIIENSFFLEMRAIDKVIEAIANNATSHTSILISYALDHPENKTLRLLLKGQQFLLETLEEHENENQK